MRTTLTLDADVAECIRRETRSGRRSLKAVVNERLRIGYGLVVNEPQGTYRVKAHHGPFHPGIDTARLNQLVDDLEVETLMNEAPGRPPE